MRNYLNRRGSFTLEATIIMPMLLLCLFALVFLAMYTYQKYALLETAVYTARQRAVTWDDSRKDMESGALMTSEGGSDGLYWRLFWDHSGAKLVQRKTDSARQLAEARLAHGVFAVNEEQVDVIYSNRLVTRNVTVRLQQNVILPLWLSTMLNQEMETSITAGVSEPTEFIRNVDLAYDVLTGRLR